MTQHEQILDLLRERGAIGASNFELMKISYQYPARIHTLRHKLGHEIAVKHIKDKEWRITLTKDADAPVYKPEPPKKVKPSESIAMFDIPVEPRPRQMF